MTEQYSGSEVQYAFIGRDSPVYPATVTLRHEVFYREHGRGFDAVQDSSEADAFHLVAISGGTAAGYVRLSVNGETAVLSQLVIAPEMRGRFGIARQLILRICEKAKELGATQVVGDIRLHVAKAAAAFGFSVSDEVLPSPKTGIPHRHIRKAL